MSIRDMSSGRIPDIELRDGIAVHDLSGFSHLSLELMHQLYRQRLYLADPIPAYVMLLAKDVLTVDFEVQLHASNPKVQRVTKAIAIVGSSFMLEHLTSMFLSYHAPAYPVKRFDTEADAVCWLNQVRGDVSGGERLG